MPYMDVDEIAIEGRKKLVLMDNNILSAGDYAKEQLEKIIASGYKVDFNQALDAWLVTDDFTKLLAKVKWLDKLPNCTAIKCNYHVRSRMYFKEYDAARIRQIIVSALNSGKRDVSFKAKDSGVLAVIKNRLLNQHGLYDIIGSSV